MKRLALLCILAFALPAHGQAQWPQKPVRVIVPFPPGGVTDSIARITADWLTQRFGQTFVAENRPGASGAIAAELVARAEPDGYTLVYAPGSTVMMAPHLLKRPDFDPTKALTPVAATGSVSLYVITHPDVPVKNFKEFLAYARANPGKLNYGTPGNGTSPHIAVEVFNREANVKLTHVPYKGAGPALKDLLGGVIHLAFDPGVGLASAKAGRLRMIAIAGPNRHPDFPDVPTLQENGIKGVDGGPYFGFYVTAGTPREPIERLNQAVLKAMQDPTVRDRFKTLAVDLAEPMAPGEFAAYVRSEYQRYAKLIPELGINR